MKKIIAAVMVILTVISLTIMAQAEMRVTGFGYCGPVNEEGVCKPEKWVVYHESDHGDDRLSIEVSQNDYNRIVAAYEEEQKAIKADHENRWYIKATNWVCNAGKDVADFIVFWD